jgi:hypothetical protein
MIVPKRVYFLFVFLDKTTTIKVNFNIHKSIKYVFDIYNIHFGDITFYILYPHH